MLRRVPAGRGGGEVLEHGGDVAQVVDGVLLGVGAHQRAVVRDVRGDLELERPQRVGVGVRGSRADHPHLHRAHAFVKELYFAGVAPLFLVVRPDVQAQHQSVEGGAVRLGAGVLHAHHRLGQLFQVGVRQPRDVEIVVLPHPP